jgi:integrase
MAGNIVDLGNGKYRLRYSEGSGKNRDDWSKNISASSMREAEKELDIFIADIVKKRVPKQTNMTLTQFYSMWKEDYGLKRIAPKTFKTYSDFFESRVIPTLGHIKIQKLNASHINKFINNLQEKGVRLDTKHEDYLRQIDRYKHWESVIRGKAEKFNRELTQKEYMEIDRIRKILNELNTKADKTKYLDDVSVNYYYKILSAVLGKAVKWDILYDNPAAKADPPIPEEKEKRYINVETQLDSLLFALSKESLKKQALVLLDIFSGLRRGELMAIEWTNLDFENNIMSVKRSRQYIAKKGASDKKTKTKSSVRKIGLPQFVMDLLKMLHNEQLNAKVALGNKWTSSSKVFIQWNGKPMHIDTPSKWFPKFLKRNGMDEVNFHGLRHSFASMLLDMNYDIGSASELLGHKQKSTFLNIYAHSFKSKHSVIAEELNRRYSNKIGTFLDTTLDTDAVKKQPKQANKKQ